MSEEEAVAKAVGGGKESGVLGIFPFKMFFVPLYSILSLSYALCRCKCKVGKWEQGPGLRACACTCSLMKHLLCNRSKE